MATIDLGKIKFKWQGAYNGATSYVVDDVVESGGSTYVCIAATTGNTPPNASYWELMADKGIDADLFSISGTVQGDIYYNNGSAIARLAPGTSGNFLKTQGSGANPVWAAAGGGFQSMQVFTTGGTWTKPANITKVKVIVTGGGGGGGAGDANYNSLGGGHAGATGIKVVDVSAISSVAVTVGSGGTGATSRGSAGSGGGTSSFGTHVSAAGGSGGTNASGTGQPTLAVATGADISIVGGSSEGYQGGDLNTDMAGGSGGGVSFWGGGLGQASRVGDTGRGGSAFGSGGGSGDDDGSSASNGGNGAAGICVVEEYA